MKNSDSLINEIEITTSASGDYYTEDGLVGIERKYQDLIPSITSGTLFKQLKELKDNFTHPILFIQYNGIMEIIEDNPNIDYHAIIGALASVTARSDITVQYTGPFFAEVLFRTVSKFYDGKNETKEIRYCPIRRQATSSEVKLDIISRIPKVGRKKGLQLLEHFDNSIGNIAKADEKEIMEISGIGKVLAKQIKEVFD